MKKFNSTDEILKYYEVNGNDISHWNGLIDMKKLVENGFKFLFIKAGDGIMNKNGAMYLDERFIRNANKAIEAGLYVGYYFFFRPGNDPLAQARFFRQICKLVPKSHFAPIVDIEISDKLAVKDLAKQLKKFLDEVERLFDTQKVWGKKPIIYSRYSFLYSKIEGVGGADWIKEYDLWLARYSLEESLGNWMIWQSSETYRIPGIGGKIDLNHYRYSLSDLITYLGLQSEKPVHTINVMDKMEKKQTIVEELLSRGIPVRLSMAKMEKIYIALSNRKKLKSLDDIKKLV